MKNKALVTLGVLGIVGAGGLLATNVYAQESDSTDTITISDSEYPSIITKLAEKFNVSEDEVQSVFEEDREEHEDARLDELVSDGTLTQEQRDALEVREDELHSAMDELIKDDSLSDTDRKEAMDDLHREFENWLDEQGINLPRMEMKLEGGPRRGMGMMMKGF